MRIFWWLLLFPLLGCNTSIEEKRPNVIIILTDDQGWGDLSMNGNTDINTSNIDYLAEQGATFERFFVQPVCSPTRAEILTSRYHFRSGVRSTSSGGERIDLDEKLISEYFQNAGYRTAAFGKWHSGSQHPYHPNSRGFDEYYGFTSGHWGHYFSPAIDHNGIMTKGRGFLPDDLTNRAIDFSSNNKKPFFILLAYNTPHSPMQVPDQWYDKFEFKELRGVPKDSLAQLHARAALAMVENIDYNVGRLTDHLRAEKLEENTIVLYMSDNGPNGQRWNQDMKGRKGSTDEGGVRSPLIVRWPDKIEQGLKIPQISAAIDLGPTLFDACKIPYSSELLDGLSLLPLLLGKEQTWLERTLMHSWNGRVSIRSQSYRLGYDQNLYDMINDPSQANPIEGNIAEKDRLLKVQKDWSIQISKALNPKDERPFPFGHHSSKTDYLPVRDAINHGGIKRSNRWPNDSYFTNWTSSNDSITWDVEVMMGGQYEFFIHYTCPADRLGSLIELSIGDKALTYLINNKHDPPLVGEKEDRYPRGESLVKDFRSQSIGSLDLEQGRSTLVIKAIDIKTESVADLNRITVQRITQ